MPQILYIYIYIYIETERERERERVLILTKKKTCLAKKKYNSALYTKVTTINTKSLYHVHASPFFMFSFV